MAKVSQVYRIGVSSSKLFTLPRKVFCYGFFQGKRHPVIPFAVMSGFAFIAGCLCGILPETLGRPTLETLEDASDERAQHKPQGIEEPLTSSL